MNSAELHGTDKDPGYIREYTYRLTDKNIRILADDDARGLEIELDWEFGPVVVEVMNNVLKLVLEDGLVSWDRQDKLDACIDAYAAEYWLADNIVAQS